MIATWNGGGDLILKGDHSETFPAKFGSVISEKMSMWFFYQNMHNLHNWYKAAERKISQ
jgi:hypothetical protein